MKIKMVVLHNRLLAQRKELKLLVTGTQHNVQALDPQTNEVLGTAAAINSVDRAVIDLLHALGFEFTLENHRTLTNAIVELVAAEES